MCALTAYPMQREKLLREKLTAVVGGWAALSFPHNRVAALKWWSARERNAPYGAHRAETIVACGLPLDVTDHLALGISALTHATSWTIVRAVRTRKSDPRGRCVLFFSLIVRADIRILEGRVFLEFRNISRISECMRGKKLAITAKF